MKNHPDSQLIIYQTELGDTKIEVRLVNETVWLTQKLMAELFQVKPQNITMHLKNIYQEGELVESSTCKDFLQVQKEGSRRVQRRQKFYNLDAIISVGYRVRSHVAKNYLDEEELAALNNLVEQYLIFAEGQAMRRVPMTMQNWIVKLDGFLGLNDRDILNHAGRVSHQLAKQMAEQEYDIFNHNRIAGADQLEGDFEKAIKEIPAHKGKS
ncbi:MAG TPA: hypothetical protein EYP35_05595 [Desulfobacterales bacterium]|nr:hypothetical protein [Desulfobacterales bacterium]HIP40335.1 hypothetical protein [Desulfocapsa sulfexigens]